MLVQMQQRRGTAAEWTSVNPILAEGEEGLEKDTRRLKLGDGVTAWNALPYYATDPADAAVAALLTGPSSTHDEVLLLIAGGSAGSINFFPIVGAAGDGTTDDRVPIQNAIDAAYAAGGGTVMLDRAKRYGWAGTITVKTGVYLVGGATRQPLGVGVAPSVPGLVALNANCQLRVGDWAGFSAPGGVANLFVDGNFVGGSTPTKKGLVRIAGVNVLVMNLFCERSAGDGIVYDGTQNSTIIGCQSSIHVGSALVLDNGPGALSFNGGYYGTSKGGVLTCRDTAGETNFYQFGPTQITFNGTIFEAYTGQPSPIAEPYDHHVHVSGTSFLFSGCNFTGGAANSAGCSVLVDDTVSAIPCTATFNTCVYWVRDTYDAVRIKGLALVTFMGLQESTDDGTHHAVSFCCADTTSPQVSMTGSVVLNGDTNGTLIFRAINGGTTANFFTLRDGGLQMRMRAGQVFGVRREGDTGHRVYIDRDGTLAWFAGAPASSLAYIQRGSAGAGNGLDYYSAAGGLHKFLGAGISATAGLARAGYFDHAQPSLYAGDSGVAINPLLESTWRIVFFSASSPALTVINPGTGGRELTLVLVANAGPPTISWPASFRFASGTAPTLATGTATILRMRYDSNYNLWFETGRTIGVPIT